jgi:Trk K+ transport system NAD-binding subunit
MFIVCDNRSRSEGSERSVSAGCSVGLEIPPTCVIAAVIRDAKIVTPRGNMLFYEGDEVLAVVDNPARQALRKLFAPN